MPDTQLLRYRNPLGVVGPNLGVFSRNPTLYSPRFCGSSNLVDEFSFPEEWSQLVKLSKRFPKCCHESAQQKQVRR